MSFRPRWVCTACGDRYGRRLPGIHTWHEGICDICGAERVPVAAPRHFGYLPSARLACRILLRSGEVLLMDLTHQPLDLHRLVAVDAALTASGSGPIVSVRVAGMTFTRASNGAFIKQENR